MQVMSNLMSNAAKFSHQNSQIEVQAGRRNDGIRITVRDYGPGIPLNFQNRVFEKFTQADTSDKREMSGTGLGLHISKAIIERHHGELSFDTVIGQGTEFHIDLKQQLQRQGSPQ
jgi:signal transduction histidine kinase